MQPGSSFGPPYRIHWRDEARADVRRLDRATAMRIFEGVLHFAHTGGGDLTSLHGDLAGSFRLRLGDYRVLFNLEQNTMSISGIRNRFGVTCHPARRCEASCLSSGLTPVGSSGGSESGDRATRPRRDIDTAKRRFAQLSGGGE